MSSVQQMPRVPLVELLREPLRNGHSAKASGTDQGIPTLTLSAVTNGDFSEKNVKATVAEPEKVRDLWLEPGDILVERSNTPELVGTARLYRGLPNYAIFPDLLIRVRLNERADERFVEAFLQSPEVRRYFQRSAQGIAGSMPKISQGTIEALEVPLPPKRRQIALVDEIEKHLSHIEVGVAALERVQTNLKRYRASVLKAACEGRLVPTEAELARKERRDYEPADVLLKRILVERRKRWETAELAKLKAKGKSPGDSSWKKKYEEPKPPDTSGLQELPEGWCWATVDAVCTHIVDCLHKTPTYTDVGYPAIRTADVVLGKLLLEQARRVDEATYRERVSRLEPLPGDVLYTREGERYGLAAVVPDGVQLCLSQRMMQFRVARSLSPEFFMWVLNSPFVYAQATRDVGGSTSPHVNIGSIRQFPIPMAPLGEQRRIAAVLDEFFSVAEKTDDVARANTQRAGTLRQSILRAAFSGKLLRTE